VEKYTRNDVIKEMVEAVHTARKFGVKYVGEWKSSQRWAAPAIHAAFAHKL